MSSTLLKEQLSAVLRSQDASNKPPSRKKVKKMRKLAKKNISNIGNSHIFLIRYNISDSNDHISEKATKVLRQKEKDKEIVTRILSKEKKFLPNRAEALVALKVQVKSKK